MQFFEKPWKSLENRDIKVVTTEARRNYFVSEPNYHRTEKFSDNLLAIEMKKNNKKKQVFMNKPAYLGLSKLEVSKI